MISSPTQDTQAALLLCAKLGQQYDIAKPLTARQYSTLAKWLQARSLRPRDLLQNSGRTQLSELQVSEVGSDQIERLLDRGAALGVMVERWTSRGVWLISREDEEYPARYKTYLQHRAPPIIYGVGEQSTLQSGGLAVVGLRDASEEDMSFAQRVGTACAEQRITVISGAAKGIDSESMMAAINERGVAIGVLADGLGRTAVSGPYHEAILEGRLTLISPYEPESPWFAFAAMERNKLIYALADAALVVASSDEKGGTWAGAVEALKQKQIPVYVKDSGVIPVGNRKLIQSGAQEFAPEPWNNLHQLFESSSASGLLFGEQSQHAETTSDDFVSEQPAPDPPKSPLAPTTLEVAMEQDRNGDGGYDHIVEAILGVLVSPMSERSIAAKLSAPLSKVRAGLKRAIEEGRVQKTKKPARYAKGPNSLPLCANEVNQFPLFKRP